MYLAPRQSHRKPADYGMADPDQEARLRRAEEAIREHDRTIAEIQRQQAELQRQQAVTSTLLQSIQTDQQKLTATVDKVVARVEENERETQSYRMGQAWTNGRNMGIGMAVVFFVGAIGSFVTSWLTRLLGIGS